ncbi:uncharacterized protein PHACADRAFT_207044 [Phanerochaete carnosa HHB-10118-sp]|uniref:XLF-like N-terminal domain-containing protein n=1 Tax=Phanerochaete carnosa (strain HHB-10118-sp) TaxID=650164 RepID=K5WFW9_PHACS|nr:uncharacterized protein PHACADRAFT_207044 [Phanerochaete carnosa HHB-10118-sp]EKM58210.1 hypothetical protein PHACADRAFT_207044 [Phanerochaete carnosa HHB-10118-sp]
MQYLTEENLKSLLHKEWLVKNDNSRSIPYLLKFYASIVDQCCCIMVTDTRQVWGEVLSSKQVARRWRDCNSQPSPPRDQSDGEEDEWRLQTLDLLASAHSPGGIIDLTFDIVESRNADLAFELGSDDFKWRWETYYLGPRVSADVLSQHLIMPLISVTHLAFSSADPVSELSEADLEKPPVDVSREIVTRASSHSQKEELPAAAKPASRATHAETPAPAPAEDDESATEPEASASNVVPGQGRTSPSLSSPPRAFGSGAAPMSRQDSPIPHAHAVSASRGPEDAPPARPNKKTKRVESSSEDESEGDRRQRLAQRKTASRGAKQPLKRGGRRF